MKKISFVMLCISFVMAEKPPPPYLLENSEINLVIEGELCFAQEISPGFRDNPMGDCKYIDSVPKNFKEMEKY